MNAIKRYSVGTKNKDLRKAADGSLTIYVQADEPKDPVERANWLPSPRGADFSLYVRAYWPEEAVTRGQWTPLAVVKVRWNWDRRREPNEHGQSGVDERIARRVRDGGLRRPGPERDEQRAPCGGVAGRD